MSGARWPAGYGPETFIAGFALHQSADLGRAYPDFYHESPHNIYLDTLVAQGVAGPVLLLALAASGFAAAIVSRRSVPRILPQGALAAGLAAMTIGEQFTSFTHAHRAGLLCRHRDAGIAQRHCGSRHRGRLAGAGRAWQWR
jgi:O-antigen ligase